MSSHGLVQATLFVFVFSICSALRSSNREESIVFVLCSVLFFIFFLSLLALYSIERLAGSSVELEMGERARNGQSTQLTSPFLAMLASCYTFSERREEKVRAVVIDV